MYPTAAQFALIGQSFPSDAFQDLHRNGLVTRQARRMVRSVRAAAVWRASGEPVVVPACLRT